MKFFQKIKKFVKNIVIFAVVFAVMFSNIPFYVLTGAIEGYIKTANIVDTAWRVSQDDNVVDKFVLFRNFSEKFKVHNALAAGPSFVVEGNASAGTRAISVAWPAHQTNDIGILFVETANQAITLTTNAADWTEITNSPQGTGTAGGTASTRLGVYWSRATSGAMGAVGIGDSGNHQRARIITFRNVIESGSPIDISAGGVQATAVTAVSIPGAVTTVDNTLVVAIVANATDSNLSQSTDNWANASLTGLIEISSDNNQNGNGGGHSVAVGTKDTAGTYNATTLTLTTSSVQGKLSFALKPLPKPTVTAINPTAGNNVGPVSLTSVTGTNFINGATVTLTKSGETSITCTGITFSSATSLTGGSCDITGALIGQWNVVVTNPDNQNGTLTNGFTINAPAETTPPTPDPMTFATAPNNTSAIQIDMTATTATDATTPPVSYYFALDTSACTPANVGSGAADSGWQSGTTYSDTGLSVNKCYGYKVKARDSVGTPNETGYSGITTLYTSANTPSAPTVGSPTSNSLVITNNENGNPLSNPVTYFAVQVTTTDGNWNNKWVDGSGNASASEVWLTDAQLTNLTVNGLQASTLYDFKSKARNEDGDNTSLSVAGSGTTSAPAGPDATSYANGTETALDFANCGTTGCGARVTTGSNQTITISGTGFGTVSAGSRANCAGGAGTGCVKVANYTIPDTNVIAWTDTSIQFRVPSAVSVYGGSGTTCGGADGNGLCVYAAGNADTGGALQFWVFPDIVSTSPTPSTGAKEGDAITISGTRFGSAGGTLVFQNCAGGDVDATPTGGNWTDTSLSVTVPSGISDTDDSCDIKITRAAGTGSKTDTETNFVILPKITSFSTNAASARECVSTDTDCNDTDTDGLVKLIGNHFGTSAGTAQFTGAFGSISATVHAAAEGPCNVGGWAAAGTSVCIETNPSISDSVYVGNITLTRNGDSKTHDYTSFRILPRITSITPSADGVNLDARTVNGNHFCQSGSCLSAASWNATADDGDDVKFGTTNATVTGTPSDTAVAVTVPSLTPGGYTVTLTSSNYASNGKPFTYLDNTPANPLSLNQYQSNCTTAITDEATTTSSTVCLKGNVSGGITGGTLYLQVEVRTSATAFSDATAESAGASAPSGGTESVSVTPDQGTYKWRARTCHNNGGTHNLSCAGTGDYPSAAWVEFETGAVPTNDFTIDSNGPLISNISSGTPGEFSVTITWNTDELATSNINYGATTTGPYNFIAPNPADTIADNTSHSVPISTNLNCGTTHYYIVKSADTQGTLSTSSEQTFTTGTCNPRVMKTLEFDWVELTGAVTDTSDNSVGSLSANIEESTDSDFTIRSAILEMRGVARGTGSGTTPTANVWLNTPGTTPTAIELPNTTIPQDFTIRYNIPVGDLNIANSGTPASNTVHYQFGGTGFSKASLVNVKLIITYDYTP